LEAKKLRCEADNSSPPFTLGSGNERTWEVRVKDSRFLPHSGTFHTVPSASIGNKLGRRKRNSLITRGKYRKWGKKRKGEAKQKEEKKSIIILPIFFSVKVKNRGLVFTLSYTLVVLCLCAGNFTFHLPHTHTNTHTHKHTPTLNSYTIPPSENLQ